MARLHWILAALAVVALPFVATAQPARMPVSVRASAPVEPDAIPLYGDKTPGSLATETWSRPAARSWA